MLHICTLDRFFARYHFAAAIPTLPHANHKAQFMPRITNWQMRTSARMATHPRRLGLPLGFRFRIHYGLPFIARTLNRGRGGLAGAWPMIVPPSSEFPTAAPTNASQ